MTKIALDAGHGYNTAGKRSPDDEREWSFNNKVAGYTSERLKQYEITSFRTDDTTGKTDVGINERVKRALNGKASLMVSIHQNAFLSKWGSHGGTETLYQPDNTKNSKKLAQDIQGELVKVLELANRGIKPRVDLGVLNGTKKSIPCVLTEGAFMDSSIDIRVLRSEELLKKQGYAIADGIAKFLNIKIKDNPEPPKKDEQKEGQNLELLNVTGRESAKGLIRKGVAEKLFDDSHKDLEKYNDIQLISFALAYVNRKLK